MRNPSPLVSARSFLFVPGHRPERFDKAVHSGADAVILDLEDAVPAAMKAAARNAIADAWGRLRASATPVMIRINAPGTRAADEDLAWIAGLAGLLGVMVPKSERKADVERVTAGVPEVAIVPLIESAFGYLRVHEIAAAASVLRLAIGHIDFLADTGMQCSEGEPELDALRFAVAMATRANGLAPAIDGVTVDIDAPERIRSDTLRSLRFGFGAKLCIHPKQLASIHQAFRPSEKELQWARRVIEADRAAGGAAVQLDGHMVDAPVVLQARRLLARFE